MRKLIRIRILTVTERDDDEVLKNEEPKNEETKNELPKNEQKEIKV